MRMQVIRQDDFIAVLDLLDETSAPIGRGHFCLSSVSDARKVAALLATLTDEINTLRDKVDSLLAEADKTEHFIDQLVRLHHRIVRDS